jgi:hypothetical protein
MIPNVHTLPSKPSLYVVKLDITDIILLCTIMNIQKRWGTNKAFYLEHCSKRTHERTKIYKPIFNYIVCFCVYRNPWYILSDELHPIHSKPDCSDQHSFVIDPVYVLKGLRDFVTKLSAKQYRSACAMLGKYLLLGHMEEKEHHTRYSDLFTITCFTEHSGLALASKPKYKM